MSTNSDIREEQNAVVNAESCEAEKTKDETMDATIKATTTVDVGTNEEDLNCSEMVAEASRVAAERKDETLSTMAAAAAMALDEVGYSHGNKIVDDDDKDWDKSISPPSSSPQQRSRAPPSLPGVPVKAASTDTKEVTPNSPAADPVAAAAVAAMVASARSSLQLGRPVAAKAPLLTPIKKQEEPATSETPGIDQDETSETPSSERTQEIAPKPFESNASDDDDDEPAEAGLPPSSILSAATDAAIDALSVPAVSEDPVPSTAVEGGSRSSDKTLAEIQAEKERSRTSVEQQNNATTTDTNETELPTDASTPISPIVPVSSFDPLGPATPPSSETEKPTSVQTDAPQPTSHEQNAELIGATIPSAEAATQPASTVPSTQLTSAPTSQVDQTTSDASLSHPTPTNTIPENPSVAMDKADVHPLTNTDSAPTKDELVSEDDIAPIPVSASESSAERGPMWQRAKELAKEHELLRMEKKEVDAEIERFARERAGVPAQISMTIPNEGHSPCARSMRSDAGNHQAQFSNSFLDRTRSRGDVDSVSSPVEQGQRGAQTSLLRVATQTDLPGGLISHTSPGSVVTRQTNDPGIFVQSKVANKRVKVVQLLVHGIIGIIVGFFGSIYVQFTCYFISSNVKVGGNAQEFQLHLGLWKYSPIDSVFAGYSYCYEYDDDEWSNTFPMVSKICAITAMVSGGIAMAVLWTYLMVGKTRGLFWYMAVRLLVLAGLCQSSTFFMFLSDSCRQSGCTIGPGAGVSIAVTIVWFAVAYEMHHNSPLSAMIQYGPFSRVKEWWDDLPIHDAPQRKKAKENVIESFARVNPLQAAVGLNVVQSTAKSSKRGMEEEHYYGENSISAPDSFTEGGTAYQEYGERLAKLARSHSIGPTDEESHRNGSRRRSRSRSRSRSRDRGRSYRPPPVDLV